MHFFADISKYLYKMTWSEERGAGATCPKGMSGGTVMINGHKHKRKRRGRKKAV